MVLDNSHCSERRVIARYITDRGETLLRQQQLPDGSLVFEIISNGVFLMASNNQVSERALANYGLETVVTQYGSELRVLVGGLGMGLTLQETLISNIVSVDVVEIAPDIIDWNKTHFATLNGKALSDSRVTIIRDDLYTTLYASPMMKYHAIMLDVDNGPSWLSHKDNTRLYTLKTLERISRILVSGGVLTVWSAQSEPEFLSRMQSVFEHTEEIPIIVSSKNGKKIENFIYRGILV